MKKTIITLLLCILSCATSGVMAQQALFLQDNYYQKRMNKVFKSLKDHKLDKAAKYWEDIKNKSAKDKDIDPNIDISRQLYPLWQISECMMMNIRDGRGKSTQCLPYDPWQAYRQLRSLYKDSYDIASADLFFQDDRNLSMTVNDIKTDIERNLVDSVRKTSTEAIYDELIEILFDCPQMAALKDEREQVAYEAIKYVDDLDRCQGYLDKYKDENKSHFMTIEWRRDSIAFEQVDSTSASCLRYMDRYPKSRFYSEVKERLHHCAFNEMDATVNACKQYLEKYPDSRFVFRVKDMEEEYAFRDAKAKNTVGSYNDFIDTYPGAEAVEDATRLMQQVFDQRYFNNRVARADLFTYYNAVNKVERINDAKVKALFENLLLMPTSTVMNGCDGLQGEVSVTTTNPNGSENVEEFVFNQQGLIIRHANRATNQSEDYAYDFDSTFGFKMVSKTDARGRTVNYQTKWNDDGSLAEIKGSDGSRIVYMDSEECFKKVLHYKGNSVVKTDCFDSHYRLVKSILSGNQTVEYWYNPQGDVSSMTKMHGTDIVEENTFEYDYEENTETGRHWVSKTQFNSNNKVVQTRVRHFYQTINRVQSDARQYFEIDWNFENEPTAVSDKDLPRL